MAGHRKGFIDKVVERSTASASQREQSEDGPPFWQNLHAWIAIACGAILLLVTYGYTAEHSFGHDAAHEVGFALGRIVI